MGKKGFINYSDDQWILKKLSQRSCHKTQKWKQSINGIRMDTLIDVKDHTKCPDNMTSLMIKHWLRKIIEKCHQHKLDIHPGKEALIPYKESCLQLKTYETESKSTGRKYSGRKSSSVNLENNLSVLPTRKELSHDPEILLLGGDAR